MRTNVLLDFANPAHQMYGNYLKKSATSRTMNSQASLGAQSVSIWHVIMDILPVPVICVDIDVSASCFPIR